MMTRMVSALCLLILPLSLPAADAPAPLGKLLSRLYPSMGGSESAVVLVSLKDKGPRGMRELHKAADLLSPKSIARRSRVMDRADVLTTEDLPLEASYVARIAAIVGRTRHSLKWFNAVSAEATKPQIDELRKLPFVREIELVGRWRGTPEPEEDASKGARPPDIPDGTQAHLLDYGASITQNALSDIPEVHDMGIHGEGVTVGVFDNGFRLLTHESFASMNIVAQYDFVDHKVSVVPNNPSTAFGSHGVNTLSTIGGYKPGQLIGPAFRADYILARTENDSSETPVEEDNWAAAIEWADSIGVDVTSTSLGYLGYQAPYTGWTSADMDGNTTLITKAADHAVSLGIVVVNSAGNEGTGDGFINTLIAPADGDSVITSGAVTSTGVKASFSSTGPTTDVPARTKPDIMAMGVGVRVASSSFTTSYGSANGTSFSCPLSAGIAALILSANPSLGPLQVRDAMRNTADNAATPDNFIGWGILDADSAIGYWGVVPMARLSGAVYHDLNGNGVQDGGETGLSGETIYLAGPTADTAASGIGGGFAFDPLAVGSYTLAVELAPGWIVTTPPGSLVAQLLHRDTVSGVSIGLFHPGTVSGTVYGDTNASGTKDPGEAGLGGWMIVLDGPASDTTLTDGTGAWSFGGLAVGQYTIAQQPQDGWLQSFPPSYGVHTVTVSDGFDTTGLEFGNVFSPANTFPVSAGWNLLSLPVAMAEPLADSVYPGAISAVSLYANGYYSADTLPNGKGYWVKFPSAQNILIQGFERTLDTIDVVAGWNLIGTLSGPVAIGSIAQSPPGIIQSGFYAFRSNAYQNVSADSFLQPHEGYWVKSSSGGELVLESEYAWVGRKFTGGCQCDTGCGYVPPDTEADLTAQGIAVLAAQVNMLPLCHACDCPSYDAYHYALIRKSDAGAAGALGYIPMNPPGF